MNDMTDKRGCNKGIRAEVKGDAILLRELLINKGDDGKNGYTTEMHLQNRFCKSKNLRKSIKSALSAC